MAADAAVVEPRLQRRCRIGVIAKAVGARVDGAGTRIRTGDLPLTRRLLYQLSYAGMADAPNARWKQRVRKSADADSTAAGRNRANATALRRHRSAIRMR